MILPTNTIGVPGPLHTPTQLGFVALAAFVLHGVFLDVQTIRHCDLEHPL